MHVAASCPKDKTVFLIYMEGGKVVGAICEKAKAVCVQTMAGSGTVMSALPQLLMSAELQGVPTDFSLVRLDRACGELEIPLREFFGMPVELFSPGFAEFFRDARLAQRSPPLLVAQGTPRC